MQETLTADLLLDLDVLADPAAFYAALRADAPVWKVPGLDLVYVSTHELVAEACRRTDDFSNHLETLVVRGVNGQAELYHAEMGAGTTTLATADPPEHTRHRAVVFPELVAKRMAALEATVSAFVDDQLATIRGERRLEWTSTVANPVPARTISAVIGLPDEDWPDVMRWAMNGTALLAGVRTLEQLEPFMGDAEAAGIYLATRLFEAAEAPGDDLLGVCARAVADEELTLEDALATLVILLGAGGESTASLIGNAVRILAERPDLQEAVRADRSLLASYIEEVLRLESPFKGHFRKVRRPCELGGVTIQAGTTMLLLWAAANRDEDSFGAAGDVRLDREIPRSHLAFGRGVHHCVGAPLARLEAATAVGGLLDATDSFSLDSEDPPSWEPSIFVRRHERLPLLVEWAT